MSTHEQVDVCILGGGVIGLTCALELANAGLFVRLIDKEPRGSSRHNVGEMSHAPTPESMRAFLKFSLQNWRQLRGADGQDLGLEKQDFIELALNEEELKLYKEESLAAQEAGIDSMFVEDKAEISKLLGTGRYGDDVLAAKHVQNETVVDTRRTLDRLRQAVIRSGVRIWGSDEVGEFLTHGNRIVGVKTTDGEICQANHTLICGGVAAMKPLMSQLNVNIPLRPARAHLLQVQANDVMPEQFILRRMPHGRLFLKKLSNGRTLLSYDGIMDPSQATYSLLEDEDALPWILARGTELFKALDHATILETQTVHLSVTPDFLPCVGPYHSWEGLYFAIGMNGRSYAYAAGVAKSLLSMILGQELPLNIDFLRPDRFVRGMWTQVPYPPDLEAVKNHKLPEPVLEEQAEAQFAENVHTEEHEDPQFAENVQTVEHHVEHADDIQMTEKHVEGLHKEIHEIDHKVTSAASLASEKEEKKAQAAAPLDAGNMMSGKPQNPNAEATSLQSDVLAQAQSALGATSENKPINTEDDEEVPEMSDKVDVQEHQEQRMQDVKDALEIDPSELEEVDLEVVDSVEDMLGMKKQDELDEGTESVQASEEDLDELLKAKMPKIGGELGFKEDKKKGVQTSSIVNTKL